MHQVSRLITKDMQSMCLTSTALFFCAVAGTELFGDSFHYGCIDPATGAREDDFAKVADEFGCGDRQCPAAFPVCNVSVTAEALCAWAQLSTGGMMSLGQLDRCCSTTSTNNPRMLLC